MKAQYGILRFAKYKGSEIGHIESHNERTKERYTQALELIERIPPDVLTEYSYKSNKNINYERKGGRDI